MMKKLTKTLIHFFLILLIIGSSVVNNSCCSLCDISVDTTLVIDTLYVKDTLYFEIDSSTADDEANLWWESFGISDDSTYTVYGYDTAYYDTVVFYENSIYHDYYYKIVSDTAFAKTEYAEARSYVQDMKIILQLQQKDSLIALVKDSLSYVINSKESIIKEKTSVSERIHKKARFFTIAFFISLGVLFVLLIIIKILIALYKRE